MLEATVRGDVEEVKRVLNEGANPNVKDELSSTPLHNMTKEGNIVISRLLLEYGASQDARDESNSTPLHYAAQNGNLEMVKLLLDFWADLQAKDKTSSMPLHYAANDAIVQLLVSNGETPIEAKAGQVRKFKATVGWKLCLCMLPICEFSLC